jgi:hypothetical protein
VALLLCLAAAVPAAAAADPAADCEAAFAADRDGWNSCACFYRLAREPARREAARHRLDVLAAEDLPCPHFYLGSLNFEEGGDPGPHYRRAAELYGRRGQPQGVYYTRMSLARWYRGRTVYDRALAEMERAAAAASELGDPRLAAATELEHAGLALSRGADLAALEEALAGLHRRAGEEGWDEIELAAADKLAQVRFRIGELDRAREVLDRLAERYRLRGDGYAEATARLNAALGSLQGFPSEPARAAAVERLEAALAVAEAAGNRRAQAVALRKLGELEPGAEGDELLARSLAIARRLAEPEVLYGTLLARAERLAAGRPAEALRLAAEAAAVRPADGTPDFLAEGWLHRQRIAWRTAPPAEALAASLEVLDEIERLRLEQSATRAEYFAVWLPAHQWLAGTLLAHAAAWTAGGGEVPAPGSAQDGAAPVAVTEPRWLESAFAVGERMRGRIMLEEAPVETGTAAGTEPATIERVRAALGPGEAMLWFQVGLWRNFYGRFEGGGWLLAIHRDGARLYALPDAGRLDPAIGHFSGLFEARDGGEARAAAVLFRQLLGAAIDELPAAVEHLLLVPDGALHRLPFGALRDASGRSLAERFELSVVPSATLWAGWRAAPPGPAERPALVLAAPNLGTSGGGSDGRSTRSAAGPWEPLPGARREARRIRRALGRGSSVLEGAAASEAAVRRAAGGRFAILHFAAHALGDERRGGRAGILLSPGAGAGAGEDGLLEPAEILRLDLDDELVVLATCRSGSGRVLYGEGPLSLAHTFFRAGAGSVVASLWPLEDDEAEALFSPFYRRLAAGDSVAAALARAQRERARAGAPAAAWAGVVALGDGAATPFPGGLGSGSAAGVAVRAAPWLAAGGLVLAAGLLAARLVAARRRR